MSSAMTRAQLEIRYDESARAYLASLPLEHHMEAPPQATQRKITLESFDVLRLDRPDVHCFNELLVQYPYGQMEETGKVVPDNMIVLHDGPLEMGNSFAVELQPVGPLLVLEYVSKGSERKDYEESFRKYEHELKVPYYLLFYPETQDLSLFRRGKSRYVSVKPNAAGRLAIRELELEIALLDGWARYWFRGELLDLPADLKRSLVEAKEEARRAKEEARRAKEETRRANAETRQARTDIDQLRAQLRALGVEPNS
jgi:Uma2 family endonuclease